MDTVNKYEIWNPSYLKSLFTSITHTYLLYVKTLNINISLSDDTLFGGLICVFLMISLPLKCNIKITEEQWNNILIKCYAYVGMYLLLDHYLDSPDINIMNKGELIRLVVNDFDDGACAGVPQNIIVSENINVSNKDTVPESSNVDTVPENSNKDMSSNIDMNNNTNISNKDINLIYNKLLLLKKRLITTPEDLNKFKLLVNATMKSYEIQKQSNLSNNEYLHACKLKGGHTILVGARIIYGDLLNIISDKELLKLGYCVQLFDDIIDCSSDIKNGINTACTNLILNGKKLDMMFMLLTKKTLTLSKCFDIQGFAVRCALYYSANHSGNYSKSFKKFFGIYSKKYSATKREKKFIADIEEHLMNIYNKL